MTERLLQYIWQFGYFNNAHLLTTAGQPIQIIHPGNYNTNQGPDFINAKIKIDQTLWAGSVELHINTSDWKAHKHSADANYRNVILHVVWKDDTDLALPFPTLALQNRIPRMLLDRYEQLMQSSKFIACDAHIQTVKPIIVSAWKDSLLAQRLQQKAFHIRSMLAENNQHWDETFWWLLARNFGVKLNSDAFEKVARSIPMNVLGRHRPQIIQLEALLLGQAAMLDKTFDEDYPNMLRKEYQFLQKKYGLTKVHMPMYYLRMRPANFPSIRFAQLAVLIHENRYLFSSIRDIDSLKQMEKMLAVTANDYWHYHYSLDHPTAFKKKSLGQDMIRNIIINTIAPMLYAYGYLNNIELYKSRAVEWLDYLPAENNRISTGFEKIGLTVFNAFDSQALIHLKNEYCNEKRCLQCAIGSKILGQ